MQKPSKTPLENTRQELLNTLTKLHGPVLSSNVLWHVLGYPSSAAFRQSRVRGHVTIKEFRLEGRRGSFALTSDVVDWLINSSNQAETHKPRAVPVNFGVKNERGRKT